MTFNACLLPSSKASGRKSQCLQTCAAGVGFIWGWVKSQNLWIYHISGNKRPITSYYRVPNVPGFWPIAIYSLCLYSTTQKQLSNSSFGGGLLIKHGFWTQVIMFDRISIASSQRKKGPFKNKRWILIWVNMCFRSFLGSRTSHFWVPNYLRYTHTAMSIPMMLNTVGCWQTAQTPTCFLGG